MARRWKGMLACALLAGLAPCVFAAEPVGLLGPFSDSARVHGADLHAQSRPTRLIVKFAEGVAAADPDFLQTLSSQVGVRLAYERAMSGGAHLYRIDGALTRDELQRVLALLRARTDVIYAEEDRVARPATG